MRERGWAGLVVEGETPQQPPAGLGRESALKRAEESATRGGACSPGREKAGTAKAVQRLRGEDKGPERGWGRVELHSGGGRG